MGRIELFSEKNFSGSCQGFVDSFPALGYRRVCPQSAIVENGSWTIYSNLGFQGRFLILPAGRYEDLTQILGQLGFYEAQSIKSNEPKLINDPTMLFSKMHLTESDSMEC